MATSNVKSLLARMQDVAAKSQSIDVDQTARAELLQLSRELTTSLEQPDEVVSLVAFSGGRNMCVRLANDLRLFDLLEEKSPRSYAEIAKVTGAEEGLLVRIFRTLVGMGFVQQVGKNEVAANPVSRQMTKASVRAGVDYFYDQGLPILALVPAYFKSNGYQLPQSMTDGPFQYAHNTTDDCYTYWSKQPGVMERFNTFMQGLFGTPQRLGWADWFPLEDVCLDGFDPGQSEYVFVDVGGGKGHESELVLKKYPETKGKLIVQDLPFVIDDITELDPRIERMKQDFTQPQPIKGARTYFLQNILHNWASPVGHKILTHLKVAMIPGYSKLLVGNIILSDENVPLRASGLDIAMLYLHSGSQRSEAEWRALVEGAGLRVIKVWRPQGDGDGIVEAEVPISAEPA